MNTSNKDKIVRGALSLFQAQGIKSVTMDKIAASLSVSKRTIYEHFADKEALVSECLACFKRDYDLRREEIRRTTDNTFSYLLEVFRYSVSKMRVINVNFFSDAKAMFPDHVEEVKMNRRAQIAHIQEMIEKSQEEGHINKSFSSTVLAEVYYEMMNSLHVSGVYDFTRTPASEVLRVLYNIYFRGVATEQGLVIMKNLLSGEEENWKEE
jgi:AcrR family transcriptional regulator